MNIAMVDVMYIVLVFLLLLLYVLVRRNRMLSIRFMDTKAKLKIVEKFYSEECTKRKDAEKQISVDKLTGLISENVYEEELEKRRAELKRALHDGAKIDQVIFFFDLNKFGAINKTFGHIFADTALKTFSHKLREVFCRSRDLLIRRGSGADEFIVLVEIRGGPQDILEDIKKLQAKINKKLIFTLISEDGGVPVSISASYGYASFINGSVERSSLRSVFSVLDEAEQYMKRHKRSTTLQD